MESAIVPAVPTSRPYAVLFGDSLTQRSFDAATHGWGLFLASGWQGKIDVLNRGFSGAHYGACRENFAYFRLLGSIRLQYALGGLLCERNLCARSCGPSSSSRLVQPHVPASRIVFNGFFSVTLFWGANDSCAPPSPQHVPLDEFKRNVAFMVDYIRKHCGEKTHVVMITAPAFVEAKWKDWCVKNNKPSAMWETKSNEIVAKYADAVASVRFALFLCRFCRSD